MKIGFDAKRYYHNNTGLGNYSRTLVGDLQRLFPDNDYELYDEKSWSRTFNLGRIAAEAGCDIFHGLSNELPLDCPPQSPLQREDISTTNSPLKGKLEGTMRTVVTMHDVAWLTFPDMYHFLDRKIYNFKYGRSCRKADRVVAISESTKRDVMRFYDVPEERIEVVYQPVQRYYYIPLQEREAIDILKPLDTPEFRLTDSEYILYVGSINSRKNLLSIVKALAMMKPENRPQLVVVGNGREYRVEVEKYISENGLGKYVRIETNIHNNETLQALYRQARVFVYPSFYEGFGLPVVEAALQQTPVITTTVSSLPEAAGPDACLIDPHAQDAPEQMAYHLDKLMSDTAYAKAMSEKMEKYSREMFDPDTLTRQMMRMYESLL